jgi:PPOX class probable F420-dependent enzyme
MKPPLGILAPNQVLKVRDRDRQSGFVVAEYPAKGLEMAMTIPAEIKRLLDGRNFAHFATTMKDGSPHSAPVWVGRDAERIIICTDEGSIKSRNTERDPRVAISIIDLQDPYSEAAMRGRVVERRLDSDFKYLDAISNKYVGKPYPYREEPAIALFIEIDKARYSKEPFEHTAA